MSKTIPLSTPVSVQITSSTPSSSESVIYKVMPTEDQLREGYIFDQSLPNKDDQSQLHFRILLDEPLAQELLVTYAKKLELFEFYNFWWDVQQYKEVDEKKDITIQNYFQSKYDKVYAIFEKYIAQDSQNSIGLLSSEMIGTLVSSLKTFGNLATMLTLNHPSVAQTIISNSTIAYQHTDSTEITTVANIAPWRHLNQKQNDSNGYSNNRVSALELSIIREVTELESFHEDGQHANESTGTFRKHIPLIGLKSSSNSSPKAITPRSFQGHDTVLRINSLKDFYTSSLAQEEVTAEMLNIEVQLKSINDTLIYLQQKCFTRMFSEVYLATFLQQGQSCNIDLSKTLQQSEQHPDSPPDLSPTAEFLAVLDAIHKKYNHVSIEDFDYFERLGEGGFGVVLRCRRKSTGKYYAMKVLSKIRLLYHHRGNLDKIYMERDLLASLVHPFLINLAYAFQTSEYVMLVTELADAGDLEVVFQDKFEMPQEVVSASINEAIEKAFYFDLEEKIRFYMAETVLALGYMHSKGLIYRDLKPQNILLCSDGHIKLADLGGVMDYDGVWSEAEYQLLHSKESTLLAPTNTQGNTRGKQAVTQKREAKVLMDRVLNRLSTISPHDQFNSPSQVNTRGNKPQHRNSYLFFLNGSSVKKSSKVSPSEKIRTTDQIIIPSVVAASIKIGQIEQSEKSQTNLAAKQKRRKRQSVLGTEG